LKSVELDSELLYDVLAMTTPSIMPKFAPIWTLAEGASGEALHQAWLKYLPPERQRNPPIPIEQIDANIYSLTDGFLSVLLSSSNPGRGEVYVYTDAARTPKTRIAGAGVNNWVNATYVNFAKISNATLFTPVRRGDYYRVHNNPRPVNPAV